MHPAPPGTQPPSEESATYHRQPVHGQNADQPAPNVALWEGMGLRSQRRGYKGSEHSVYCSLPFTKRCPDHPRHPGNPEETVPDLPGEKGRLGETVATTRERGTGITTAAPPTGIGQETTTVDRRNETVIGTGDPAMTTVAAPALVIKTTIGIALHH